MSSHKPLTSFLSSSVSRPAVFSSTPSRYICRPCQQQLQLQHQRKSQPQGRGLHQHITPSKVPKPTPFVPDVSTFLTLIGRKLSTHSSKFETWEQLFKLSSPELKELGIEPARSRRYLLRWREKFRKGEYGIGGDFQHVNKGVGELRVVEVPALASRKNPNSTSSQEASVSQAPGMQKIIVNVPQGATTYTLLPGQTTKDLKKPAFTKLRDGHTIIGSYVQPSKGSNGSVATLKVTEGMWEDRRGHKVHGGERRRAETLHKLGVAAHRENAR